MSVSSNGSQLSVSYFGQEMDFDTMCDDCFKDLQQYLNNLHCKVRELSMIPEQDNDYIPALDCFLELQSGVDSITDLLVELKSVGKQVLGKPPKSMKDQVAKRMAEYKQQKAQEKEQAKADKLAAKLASSSIAEEKV